MAAARHSLLSALLAMGALAACAPTQATQNTQNTQNTPGTAAGGDLAAKPAVDRQERPGTPRVRSAVQAFSVNASRLDPYQQTHFRVRWDGRFVPGMASVSAIERRSRQVEHRSGGDPGNRRVVPGLTEISPIRLMRYVTHDTSFEDWADTVWTAEGTSAISLQNYRKDITVELLNRQGTPVKAYRLYRCWPMEYQAIAALDAEYEAPAQEILEIQCEGWERDKSVAEPSEY